MTNFTLENWKFYPGHIFLSCSSGYWYWSWRQVPFILLLLLLPSPQPLGRTQAQVLCKSISRKVYCFPDGLSHQWSVGPQSHMRMFAAFLLHLTRRNLHPRRSFFAPNTTANWMGKTQGKIPRNAKKKGGAGLHTAACFNDRRVS